MFEKTVSFSAEARSAGKTYKTGVVCIPKYLNKLPVGLRESHTVFSNIIDYVYEGQFLEILSKTDCWFNVRMLGVDGAFEIGWLQSSFVKEVRKL